MFSALGEAKGNVLFWHECSEAFAMSEAKCSQGVERSEELPLAITK